MKRRRATIEQSFAIARYPVTVAQFGLFMAAGGYEEPRYWGGTHSDGWQWRMKDHGSYRGEGPVTQPEYWLQPRWHGQNRPIVGVSWYEAAAYCAWLAEESGREYRLPTEEEWERAARHTDGRQYAWGNDGQDGIINSSEAGISRTTAAGAFPRGAAACGAQDMSGNVWEWTASKIQRAGRRVVHQSLRRARDEPRQDRPVPLVRLFRVSGGLPRVLTPVSWISGFCNGGFGGSPPKAPPPSGGFCR